MTVATQIAYVILAHQLPTQVARLVRQLNAPGTFFLVHIDRRAGSAVYREAQAKLSGLDNVVFLRRHKLHWSGFGHVAATLEGIAELRTRSHPFDYLVLLTGQDYPIKPNAVIEETLARSGNRSFLEYMLVAEAFADGEERIRRWHWRRGQGPGGRHVSLPIPRRWPRGLVPYGGSSYWCLNRVCVEYAYSFASANPAFVRYLRHVDVPDEIVFQTILVNSPLREQIVNDNLRYIDWTRQPLPAILGVADLDALARSRKLFARKFDPRVDAEILDLIDRELLAETDLLPPVADARDG